MMKVFDMQERSDVTIINSDGFPTNHSLERLTKCDWTRKHRERPAMAPPVLPVIPVVNAFQKSF